MKNNWFCIIFASAFLVSCSSEEVQSEELSQAEQLTLEAQVKAVELGLPTEPFEKAAFCYGTFQTIVNGGGSDGGAFEVSNSIAKGARAAAMRLALDDVSTEGGLIAAAQSVDFASLAYADQARRMSREDEKNILAYIVHCSDYAD